MKPTQNSEELGALTRWVNTKVGGTKRIDWTGHIDFGRTKHTDWTGQYRLRTNWTYRLDRSIQTSEELDVSTVWLNTGYGRTGRIDWTGQYRLRRNWTGAPCSPQRTWAEKDGAKPLTIAFTFEPTTGAQNKTVIQRTKPFGISPDHEPGCPISHRVFCGEMWEIHKPRPCSLNGRNRIQGENTTPGCKIGNHG
jgi:hypothetical protein